VDCFLCLFFHRFLHSRASLFESAPVSEFILPTSFPGVLPPGVQIGVCGLRPVPLVAQLDDCPSPGCLHNPGTPLSRRGREACPLARMVQHQISAGLIGRGPPNVEPIDTPGVLTEFHEPQVRAPDILIQAPGCHLFFRLHLMPPSTPWGSGTDSPGDNAGGRWP